MSVTKLPRARVTRRLRPAPRVKYTSPGLGEWIAPVRRGYRLMCCDCGLVHVMDFDVEKRRSGWTRPQMRCERRDERATAAARRQNDFPCKPRKRRLR